MGELVAETVISDVLVRLVTETVEEELLVPDWLRDGVTSAERDLVSVSDVVCEWSAE